MYQLRTLFYRFVGKKYVSMLLLCTSLLVTLIISYFLATYFKNQDIRDYDEKKLTTARTFERYFNDYDILLQAYTNILTQFYLPAFQNSSYQSNAQSVQTSHKEVKALGLVQQFENYPPSLSFYEEFTSTPSNQQFKYQSILTNDLFNRIFQEKKEKPFIYKINANFFLFIQPINDYSFSFLLINQQEIFDHLAKIAPSYTEYRIFYLDRNTTPVYTRTMTDNLYFPFTSVIYIADTQVTIKDTSWLFRFYFYNSMSEITEIAIIFVIAAVGLLSSIQIFTISEKHYYAQQTAEHLESQKDEFIAIASHELKTPLTSIKALNQLLAKKMTASDNQLFDSFFNKIDTQVIRMENLINDLLDVSSIRAGKLTYTMKPFNITKTVQAITEEIEEVTKTHRITVHGSIDREILGDEDRISQVINNLVVNAIKYSPQAHLVIVSLREMDREAIIAIQDFGIGVPKDQQRRIFGRFYRVSSTEQEYKGLGIGLFISAEIIEKHGGRIWVKSTKGKGSTFFFSIPYNKKR